MSVTDNQTHPSALSDEQKAELRKMVEEEEAELAGDDGEDEGAGEAAAGNPDGGEEAAAGAEVGDDTGAAGEEGKAKPKGKAAGADEGAADDQGKPKGKEGAAAADAAGDGAEGAGKPGKGEAYVPKQQFDGVLAELRNTRQEVQTLKALATGKREPLPERDFDAEDKALDDAEAQLDAKYDTEGMADEEYRQAQRDIEKKRRALDRERNKYELHAQLVAEQEASKKEAEEQAVKAAAESWQSEVSTWQDSLGDWLKNPVRRSTVDNTMAMMNADPELAKLDNAAFLAKLDEYLADAFPNYPRAEGKGGDDGKGKGAPQPTERQRLQAQRAAEASGAPPRIEGGVGNRGTRTEDIDIERMPLGKFKELPKAKQDELLGLT